MTRARTPTSVAVPGTGFSTAAAILTASTLVVTVSCAFALPVVDKGVFVITGVKTCRDGYGYCILGTDCTVDKEFIADDLKGHCDGLKKAFTPRAFFVCCQSIENSTFAFTTSTTSTTTTPPPPPSIEEEDEENESAASGAAGSGSNEDSAGSGSPETSSEIGGGPFNLTMATTSSTTTTQPSVMEEVHTEVSFSENFQVVLGMDAIQGLSGPIRTTTTTTTSTSTARTPASSSTTSHRPATMTTTPKTTTTTSTRPPSTTTRTTTTTSTTSTTTSRPTTTTTESQVFFDQQTCGFKATFYSAAAGPGGAALPVYPTNTQGLRIDGSRLAAQQTSLVCWTAAIVRSPTSLTLQDPGSFICTGALISDEFMVTTATCVSRLFAQDLSLFKVALGSRHLVHPMNGPTPDATYKDIIQLIIHEDYNIQGLFKRVNDIALVRLAPVSSIRGDDIPLQSSKPAPYCTVCLPEAEEDHSGEDCIVTGFSHPTGSAASIDDIVAAGGSVESIGAAQAAAAAAAVISGGGTTANNVPSAHDTDGILHEAEQHIEYATGCEAQLTNFTVAQNTLLRNDLNIEQSKLVCASGKFNAEACFSPRDAGSPLACASSRSPDQYKLVGVFSSGFHCGTSSSPVLYTDVSKFTTWIRDNMRAAKERRITSHFG